jgi:hypothetical protein
LKFLSSFNSCAIPGTPTLWIANIIPVAGVDAIAIPGANLRIPEFVSGEHEIAVFKSATRTVEVDALLKELMFAI